jgi:hypothetical protein
MFLILLMQAIFISRATFVERGFQFIIGLRLGQKLLYQLAIDVLL